MTFNEHFRSNYNICASSGRPLLRRKASLIHVNDELNCSVQADYLAVYIRSKNFEVLNMVDMRTKHGKRSIALPLSAEHENYAEKFVNLQPRKPAIIFGRP